MIALTFTPDNIVTIQKNGVTNWDKTIQAVIDNVISDFPSKKEEYLKILEKTEQLKKDLKDIEKPQPFEDNTQYENLAKKASGLSGNILNRTFNLDQETCYSNILVLKKRGYTTDSINDMIEKGESNAICNGDIFKKEYHDAKQKEANKNILPDVNEILNEAVENSTYQNTIETNKSIPTSECKQEFIKLLDTKGYDLNSPAPEKQYEIQEELEQNYHLCRSKVS